MNRKEKIKLLLSERHTRLALVERDLFVFGLYYFSESFKSPSALFHREWCIAFQGSEHLLLIAFRESAKTLWLIIKIVHTICFRQKRFIAYYCYDKKKSAGRLYDIVVHLQTNKKLLRDFGCLFPSAYKSSDDEEENTKRSVTEFITTNLIKVKAMSIGESPRGELFMTKDGTFRPDFVGLDDIDVDKSVSNMDVIEKTYAWIKGEFLGGLSDECQIIFLGNIIKNDGIVIRFEQDYLNDPKWRIFRKAIVEDGKITWSERYTPEDIADKRSLLGEISFNQNMLLVPYSGGDSIIKRHYIRYGRCDHFDKIVIGADPAISERTMADNFGIVVTGHVNGRRYILACYTLKGEQKDIYNAIQFLKNTYIQWNANYVNVETVAFQKVIAKLLKKEGVAVKEIMPHRDKVTRLMEFQAEFEQGLIYFDPTGPGIKELVEELISFPNVIHDDRVDAMVYSFVRKGKVAV